MMKRYGLEGWGSITSRGTGTSLLAITLSRIALNYAHPTTQRVSGLSGWSVKLSTYLRRFVV
jgi:hypothetical protein